MSTPSTMKIGALAPWFGGKRTLAPEIIRELGPHSSFWEPMVGGFALILNKPRASHETVNDLHGDVINLARVVQDDDAGPWLFERLQRTVLAEPFLAECDWQVRYSEPPDTVDPGRAYAFFVSSWGGRNGECGLEKSERGRTVAVRWSASGGAAGVRFKAAVDSIPAWWERLRSVLILRRDAFEVIEQIKDDAKTAIYLDPPYLEKSDRYLHDFENNGGNGLMPDDHQRLADSLSRFRRARVVVSYYAHPRLAALYPGWTVIDCSRAKNLSGQSGGASVAPEVLIVNGPSYAEAAA